MKKSDAAKKLEEFFLRNYCGNRWITNDQAKEAMDFLVDELGMAPPEYEPFPGSEHEVKFRRWEDEDA